MGLPLKSITVFENILLFSSAPFSIDMASLNEEEDNGDDGDELVFPNLTMLLCIVLPEDSLSKSIPPPAVCDGIVIDLVVVRF